MNASPPYMRYIVFWLVRAFASIVSWQEALQTLSPFTMTLPHTLQWR